MSSMRGAVPETTVPSPEDGRLLLGAITSCGRGGLEACLAYFDESGWLTQLSHQLESKLRRDRDVVRRALAEAAAKYDRCSDGELVLKLLDRMDERLGLRSGPVETVGALEDRCAVIAARAVDAAKARGVVNVSSLGDLAFHELKQLLSRVTHDDQSADYRDLGTEEQTRYRASVMGFVRSLPEEQQKLFIDAAGIPALSDEYLAKAAVAGGIGAGFAAVIGLAGFGAYAFATSALASLAGLFGLTLPFGAYVGLTSTIAVLSNPVTVALSVITVGLLYRHANRELQTSRVVPMQLAGLVWGAAAMEAEPNRQLQVDTVALWSRAAADLDAARCSADEAQRRYEAALQDARRAQEAQGRAKGELQRLRQQRRSRVEDLSKHLRGLVLGAAVLPPWIVDDLGNREVVRIHRSIERRKEPASETVGVLRGLLIGGLRRIERTLMDAELARLALRLGDTPEARLSPLDGATRSLVLPILGLRQPMAAAELSFLEAHARVAEADRDVRRTREQRDTAAATARRKAGQFRGLDNRP